MSDDFTTLEELRKDHERLNWLEKERRAVDFFTMDDPGGEPTRRYVQVGGVGIEKARPTLRESIDAAMGTE